MNAQSFFARGGFSLCMSCRRDLLRRFSSTPSPFVSFQSYPLNPQPHPLPRNAQGPDTSITHPIQPPAAPRVHDTRPPKEATAPTPPPQQRSVREQEAQTPKREFAEPAAAAAGRPPAAAAAAAATAGKPRARLLRTPRKAAMRLTAAAVAQLRALLDQPEPKLIKVGVRNRGCSGLAYHLEYVDRPGPFDETVEQDGVRVLIDSKALFSIIGSEMDWVEDKLSQRFVFRNPNIKEQCGCGESFMV